MTVLRQGRFLVVAAVLLALASPPSAVASKLRLLAPSVTSFASDGTSYVAWQVPGEKSISVLDTRNGHRDQVEAPCPLADNAPAAAGRFLLECGEEEEALLDVRTGATTMLPKPPPHPYARFGPNWTGVGSRYVIGEGGTSGRCRKRHSNEGCLVLYNIASRAVTEVAESLVPDPDRPGAPPLCPTLRSRVLKLSKAEILERMGPLTPLQSDFGYTEGVVVEPEGLIKRAIAEPLKRLLVISCDGATRLVPTRSEGRWNPDGDVSDLVLSDGLLTWDTGHSSNEYYEEPGLSLRHGTLVSYTLHTRDRQSWALPVLPLTVTENGTQNVRRRVSGVFGYSTHTTTRSSG